MEWAICTLVPLRVGESWVSQGGWIQFTDVACLPKTITNPNTNNRQLPARTGHLTDGNFITRLLYKDCYWIFITVWLFTLHFSRRTSIVTAVRFVIVDFKEINEWMNNTNWAWHRVILAYPMPLLLHQTTILSIFAANGQVLRMWAFIH